jgi:hypothetical protein
MALSKNFRALMEDMRRSIPSSKSIDEDKDERVERREKRRRENTEDKFSDSSVTSKERQYGVEASASGKFRISAFIKALESLKNQIISKNVECTNRAQMEQSGTGLVAQKYNQKYLSLLDRLAGLLGEIYLRKEKEGRNLEGDEDAIIIKSFRDNYNSILTDFEQTTKSFNTDIDTKAAEYLKGLKFKEITGPLEEANKIFAAATIKLTELRNMIDLQNSSTSGAGASGASGSNGNVSTITDTIKSGVSYKKDSKEGIVVIEVKKAIYKKFEKYKTLSGSNDWKVVYKSYPNVSGSLLANTEAVIKGVKAGLAGDYEALKGDTTGNITPAFVSVLAKVNESSSNIPGKLISYNDFIKSPKLAEAFDEVAAGKAISGGSSSGSKSRSSSGSPKAEAPQFNATPFTTDAEGNNFRAWVNQKHADWAKSNNLSAAGPKNNNYIRKAYQEFGEEYKGTKAAPESVKTEESFTNKQMKDLIDKAKNAGANCHAQLTDNGDVILYFHSKDGMEYGHIYNNMKTYYRAESGKIFSGKYIPGKNMVTFDEGNKSFSFDSVVKTQITNSLSSESAENAQGKKAYVGSASGTKIYITSTYKDLDSETNVLLKYNTADKYIGLVTSTTKRDGKTLYKVTFPESIQPNKNGSNTFDSGWVKADSVNLK